MNLISSCKLHLSLRILQISIINKVKQLFKIDHEQILLYNQNVIRDVAIEYKLDILVLMGQVYICLLLNSSFVYLRCRQTQKMAFKTNGDF